MSSQFAGTPDYERFMGDLLRAKVKGRNPELKLLRGVKVKSTAGSISPVLAYMEQVVTDLVGQHGCRHSIAHIGKLRELVDAVYDELVEVSASDERIELRRINSLRQHFICLNTTTVMQDGKLRWEFTQEAGGNSRATVHDDPSLASAIAATQSLPDISGGDSIFEQLYSDAEVDKKKAEAAANSEDTRDEEIRENGHVIKNLRSRLKKSEKATVSTEVRMQALEDGRIMQADTIAAMKEDMRLLKMAYVKVKRQLGEAKAETEATKKREHEAEGLGRSEAEEELREKRKTVIKQDQRMEKLVKETDVARTEKKVMQRKLKKAGEELVDAENKKSYMFAETRQMKGALSDAQGLVRVLQENRVAASGESSGTAGADAVVEYGLRQLAEMDRVRAENLSLGDSLKAEQEQTATLITSLGEQQRQVASLRDALGSTQQRCDELTRTVFDLKIDVENATGVKMKSEPEPECEPEPSCRFRTNPKPAAALPPMAPSGSMAAAIQGSPTSSSSSGEEAYGAEDDFEEDDEEGDVEQAGAIGGGMTVAVDLGDMGDQDSEQRSSKNAMSPISPVKRARENAMMRGGQRRLRGKDLAEKELVDKELAKKAAAAAARRAASGR